MREEEFKALLNRYEKGTATDEEKAFVEGWYFQYRNKGQNVYPLSEKAGDANELWAALQPLTTEKAARSLWPRIAAAALLFIVMGIISYVILNHQADSNIAVRDIAPFTARAMLKSGGKTIFLDQTPNGKIARTNITKSAGEQLSYGDDQKTGPAVYDTIQIPAGGRPYTVRLSDGSRLTLNAATILRYPEVFSKNRKEIIELLAGEVYAQIVHDAAAPLQINAPGQVITDLGTEFNIAAYADEPDSRTTLIKGAVKVNAGDQEKTLSPGYQTILKSNNLSEGSADVLQVTAWKTGLFRFSGERLDAVMRQLARWYNIEIAYDGQVTDEVFYGVVDRGRPLSEVLRILERSQKVHFKIEERRVTVLSK